MICYVLAFDRPSLEEEYQRQHGRQRAVYDVIRVSFWVGGGSRSATVGCQPTWSMHSSGAWAGDWKDARVCERARESL